MKHLSLLFFSLMATCFVCAQSAQPQLASTVEVERVAVTEQALNDISLAKVCVFPNPCTGAFTVQTHNWEAAGKEMLVYNGMGTLVKTEKLASKFQMHKISLDLPAGLYILKFKDKEHEGLVQPLTISK